MTLFDFFRPSWKNSNPKIRIEAVRQLNDGKVSILKEVIINDPDVNIRKLAIKKINNPKLLSEIIADVPDLIIQQTIKERIDDLLTIDIIKEGDFSLAMERLVHVGDAKFLLEIAEKALLESIRYAAVKKISDFKSLSHLILSSKQYNIVKLALEQINEDGQLKELVLRIKDKELIGNIIEKITDRRVLDDLVIRGNKVLKQLAENRKRQLGIVDTKEELGSDEQIIAKKQKLCASIVSALTMTDLEAAAKLVFAAKNSFATLKKVSLDTDLDGKFDKLIERFMGRINTSVTVESKKTVEESVDYSKHVSSGGDSVSSTQNIAAQKEGFTLVQQIENLVVTDELWQDKLDKLDRKFKLFCKKFPDAKEWIEPYQSFRQKFIERQLAWRETQQTEVSGLVEKFEGTIAQLNGLLTNHHLLRVENDLKELSQQGKQLLAQLKGHRELRKNFDEVQRRVLVHLRQLKEAKSWSVWAGATKGDELYAALLSFKEHQEKVPWDVIRDLKKLKSNFLRLLRGPQDQKLRELSKNFEKEYQSIYSHWDLLQQSAYAKVIENRTTICEQLEKIVKEPFSKEERKLAEKLISDWKTAGFVPKDQGKEIFERFNRVNRLFWQKQKEIKLVLMKSAKEFEQKAETICEEMEQIASLEVISLRQTSGQVTQLRQAWKELGFIPKAKRDILWKRFKSAYESFMEKKTQRINTLKTLWEERELKKNALLDAMEQLINSPLKEIKDPERKLKEFIESFDEIGSLGRKKDELADERFAVICKKYMELYLGRFENRLPLEVLRKQFIQG